MPRMTQPPPAPGPPGYPAYPPQPKHPQAITVLVLGLLGILVCGLCGPFAWSMGNRVEREIAESQGGWGGATEATIGKVLGIVSTVLLVAGFLMVVFFLVFGAALFGSFTFHTS
jgi:uncharacterized membrane protein YjgN (DUF898 family)